MKKTAQEWVQKYYDENARSIRIHQANTMRVIEISSFTKPVLASKVETNISNNSKGKELVQELMQTSEEERSNSIETDEDLPIQFSNIPRDFSVNMTCILLETFKAKEGKSSVIKGDVEEKEIPMAVIIDKRDGPKGLLSPKFELEVFLIEELDKKTKRLECSEYGSQVIILRPKRHKMVRVTNL